MNRRELLAAAPLAGLAAASPAGRALAQAAGAEPRAQPLAGAQRFRLGERSVVALLDGALRIEPAMLQGIDAEGYAEALEAAFRDPETYRSPVNAFAIEGGEGIVLVDAGAGEAMGSGFGRALANLEAAGHAPEDVATLLVTHLHPDHIGGALRGGEPVFPNAEVVVSAADVAFWTDAATRAAAPAEAAPFFDLAAAFVAAYGDRLREIEGEAEAAPGVTAMPLPGHTPGHTGFRIDEGDRRLLLWADVVHVPPVQFARPSVAIAFDTDPAQAAETRARLLDQAAADRLLVAGAHMEFPGVAQIERAGEGFRAVPAVYDYPQG